MNINGRFARTSTVSKRKEDELLHSGIQNAIKFGLVSDGTYGRYDTKYNTKYNTRFDILTDYHNCYKLRYSLKFSF